MNKPPTPNPPNSILQTQCLPLETELLWCLRNSAHVRGQMLRCADTTVYIMLNMEREHIKPNHLLDKSRLRRLRVAALGIALRTF